MITAWTHPRQATEGCQRSSKLFVRLRGAASLVALSPLPLASRLLKRNIQLARQLQDKKNLPMLSGRQTAFTTYAFLKVKDFQRREIGINDLLKIELDNDNLIKFDQDWENIRMALDKEPEEDLV